VADAAPYTLKSFFSPPVVRRLAREIASVWPAFPSRAFDRDATTGLEALELLDRGRHIGAALGAHLPQAYPDAVDVLLRSLGAEHAGDENLGGGMAPFFYMPHLVFITDRGLDEFDLSMRAQYELTKRFTAEFSIRSFIARDPERAFGYLDRWAGDASAHVRRLVSEGTRLRLPWAMRVPWLDAHPDRIIALLDRLKDDSSSMVRRSVANSLNDLGKVHPRLLIATCRRWLKGNGQKAKGKGEGNRHGAGQGKSQKNADADQLTALIRHGLRSAIKRGDRDALRLLGYGGVPAVRIERVRFTPASVNIGGRVVMEFVLRSRASRAQQLLVDVAVHFVKASGRGSAKVFKLKTVALGPRAAVPLRASFSLKVHTTRRPQPGRHRVDVLVNGQRFSAGSFLVRRAAAGR
jgi:3-methyladenine DNA glycosylase AlkC